MIGSIGSDPGGVASNTLPAAQDPASAPAKADARLAPIRERLLAVSDSQQTSADVKLVTQQGDVVTLHASVEQDATYSRASVRQGGSRTTAESLQVSSQSNLSVSVQGDLNDQEKADIQQFLARVGNDLGAFEAGQGGVTGQEAAGLSTIASFQVQFAQSDTQTVATLVRQLPAPAAPGAPPAAAPPASPANPAPGQPEVAQRVSQGAHHAHHRHGHGRHAQRLGQPAAPSTSAPSTSAPSTAD